MRTYPVLKEVIYEILSTLEIKTERKSGSSSSDSLVALWFSVTADKYSKGLCSVRSALFLLFPVILNRALGVLLADLW